MTLSFSAVYIVCHNTDKNIYYLYILKNSEYHKIKKYKRKPAFPQIIYIK